MLVLLPTMWPPTACIAELSGAMGFAPYSKIASGTLMLDVVLIQCMFEHCLLFEKGLFPGLLVLAQLWLTPPL